MIHEVSNWEEEKYFKIPIVALLRTKLTSKVLFFTVDYVLKTFPCIGFKMSAFLRRAYNQAVGKRLRNV